MAEEGNHFSVRRIKRELRRESEEIGAYGVSFEVVNDNFSLLKAQISGPKDTPYEGGNFILELKVPKMYPLRPPLIRFVTKIWHPNIGSSDGAVCIDAEYWPPTMTIKAVLLSMRALLSVPEPNAPKDDIVAKQYMENPETFRLTAKHWSMAYAGAPGSYPDFDEKIKTLMETGVDEDDARATLSYYCWDLKEAMERYKLQSSLLFPSEPI